MTLHPFPLVSGQIPYRHKTNRQVPDRDGEKSGAGKKHDKKRLHSNYTYKKQREKQKLEHK